MARLNNKMMKKRDMMLLGLLASNPGLKHKEAIRASKDKYGCGISFENFKALKAAAMKGPPDVKEEFRKAGDELVGHLEDATKNALKKGTTRLRTQIKELGKALVESGVDGAVLTVVDGKPKWRITELRTYDI